MRDTGRKLFRIGAGFFFDEKGYEVLAVHVVDHHLVFARCAVNSLKEFIDLARENIDSLDLDHIIGTSKDCADTRVFVEIQFELQ